MASGINGTMPALAGVKAGQALVRNDAVVAIQDEGVRAEARREIAVISDSFCSSTAAMTQPCGAAPRESGTDTLANRPCSLATNEPHSRPLK